MCKASETSAGQNRHNAGPLHIHSNTHRLYGYEVADGTEATDSVSPCFRESQLKGGNWTGFLLRVHIDPEGLKTCKVKDIGKMSLYLVISTQRVDSLHRPVLDCVLSVVDKNRSVLYL